MEVSSSSAPVKSEFGKGTPFIVGGLSSLMSIE